MTETGRPQAARFCFSIHLVFGGRKDVGVSRHFLEVAILFHPYGGEAKMLGVAGIGHASAPDDGLGAGDDDGVAVNVEVFDLPVVRSDDEKTGFHHPEHVVLLNELIQRIGDDEIVGPEVRHAAHIFVDEGLRLGGVQPADFLFGGGGLRICGLCRTVQRQQ